jgi:hypothetical protein
MHNKEWAAVFNVQDIFTPLPPGTNRFVYIWAVITFRAPELFIGNIITLPVRRMEYI